MLFFFFLIRNHKYYKGFALFFFILKEILNPKKVKRKKRTHISNRLVEETCEANTKQLFLYFNRLELKLSKLAANTNKFFSYATWQVERPSGWFVCLFVLFFLFEFVSENLEFVSAKNYYFFFLNFFLFSCFWEWPLSSPAPPLFFLFSCCSVPLVFSFFFSERKIFSKVFRPPLLIERHTLSMFVR